MRSSRRYSRTRIPIIMMRGIMPARMAGSGRRREARVVEAAAAQVVAAAVARVAARAVAAAAATTRAAAAAAIAVGS